MRSKAWVVRRKPCNVTYSGDKWWDVEAWGVKREALSRLEALLRES